MKHERIPYHQLVLLNAGWAKDDEKWNFGPICSAFMRIYWVTKGSATVTMNNREYPLTEGHFYLIPPLATHYDHSSGTFEHYYLHIADEPRSSQASFQPYELPFEVTAHPTYSQFFKEICNNHPELRLPQPDPVSYENTTSLLAATQRFVDYSISERLRIHGMLYMILSLFLDKAVRQQRVTDQRINQALTYINEHICESICIAQLAEKAALSREQFIRLFYRQTGSTPTAYIITQKIYQAQILLAERKKSVKQVAAFLGYDNQSYFSRLFRQHVGMSPSMFFMQNK